MKNNSSTVAAYISQFPEDRQDILRKIRQEIKEAAPNATEMIKYGMPTYYQKENLVHFANAKHHIGFYPTPAAIEKFSEELAEYKTSKGAVQFPLSRPIPYDLIKKITLWRVQQVE
ncbi:iron chaperone [Vagococcus elongatus]|uniref:YdhG-like domain-containing protein n=1 Tax=Vagococcus elongatus TaxID=180344 RepID=A0A430AV00_9ENTE|nr:DUF1801 domain-containing protein [Vagococcus elongatus]RSU11888.1 hypothetical protein CBF29_07150 [Vagococcus elongatus]